MARSTAAELAAAFGVGAVLVGAWAMEGLRLDDGVPWQAWLGLGVCRGSAGIAAAFVVALWTSRG